MPRRRMTYELDADESKALDGFRRLTAEQRRSVLEGQKGTKTAQQQNRAVGALAGQWRALVGAAAGFASIHTVMRTAINLAKEYEQHLKKIGEIQTRVAGGAVPLAALQQPGDVQRVLREAAAISAAEGVMPEQGFAYFQRGQSVRGDWESGKESAREAMQLGRLISDHAVAAETIKIARELGMSQKEFNALIVGAAASSAADEAAFAKAAPYWPMFTRKTGEPDQHFGAALTNILSQRIDSERLPTYIQALSRTLTNVEGTLQGAISESLGKDKDFADLNLFERLGAMRQYVEREHGVVTPETVRMAGVTGQRERTALATIFTEDNFAALEKVLREAKEFSQTHDISERLATIQLAPEVRQRFLEDQTSATAQAFAFMGPESERARERAARVRAYGAESGFRMGVDEETGEAGRWMRAWRAFLERGEDSAHPAGPGGGYGYRHVPPDRAELAPTQDRLERALEMQQQVLREIADNTGADNTRHAEAQPRERAHVNMGGTLE